MNKYHSHQSQEEPAGRKQTTNSSTKVPFIYIATSFCNTQNIRNDIYLKLLMRAWHAQSSQPSKKACAYRAERCVSHTYIIYSSISHPK